VGKFDLIDIVKRKENAVQVSSPDCTSIDQAFYSRLTDHDVGITTSRKNRHVLVITLNLVNTFRV
jgi:hypothetical protein